MQRGRDCGCSQSRSRGVETAQAEAEGKSIVDSGEYGRLSKQSEIREEIIRALSDALLQSCGGVRNVKGSLDFTFVFQRSVLLPLPGDKHPIPVYIFTIVCNRTSSKRVGSEVWSGALVICMLYV
jgi:hypothetical protein